MKTILVSKKEGFSSKDYIKRSALDTDYSRLITENCKIVDEDTGQLLIVYMVMPSTPRRLLTAVLKIKYGTNKRLAGLITHSKIFGYKPREKIRNDMCTSTSLAAESPREHKIICDLAEGLTKYYKKHCSEIFDVHKVIADDKILPEWRIGKTPFSSGIVNQNNKLHYHFDSGNYSKVYSNMIALKSNCVGGHLAIPEYDIGLDIATNSIVLFDGQKILHGVTPFILKSSLAYRYTLVYYTLKTMWKCEPLTQELARIKSERTKHEKKRLHRLQGLIPNEI